MSQLPIRSTFLRPLRDKLHTEKNIKLTYEVRTEAHNTVQINFKIKDTKVLRVLVNTEDMQDKDTAATAVEELSKLIWYSYLNVYGLTSSELDFLESLLAYPSYTMTLHGDMSNLIYGLAEIKLISLSSADKDQWDVVLMQDGVDAVALLSGEEP